jgi:ribosomal protein S18 acetylase RimI-like enzyme
MITLENEPTVLATSSNSEESAIAPLVLAFASDPAVRWMYPNAHQYRTFFPRFARAFGGKAFALGTAHHLDDFRGTALWLPPGVAPDDDLLIPFLEETIAPERLGDAFAVFEQMGAYHPSVPHWYLPLLGVDPLRQSQGLGSALIEPILAAFDRDGAVAYLEASNPRNVPFYERHGFEVRGEIQAGDSPSIFPMVREPR